MTKSSRKTGLPPGSIVHIGKKKTNKVEISLFDYSQKKFQEKKLKKIEDAFPFKKKSTVTWINIDGIHDTKVLERIGECFGIHPLVLEDIVNTSQRPKMEDFGDYMFLVLKMLYFNKKRNKIESEQVSIILGKNFVISFQEKEGDTFDPVRERIRNGKGRMRKSGADYLAYSLLDSVVDNYFVIMEKVGEKMEKLEDDVISNPRPETLKKVHKLKRDMISLRKSVWPLRELISSMQRLDSKLVDKKTGIYLRDLYDHTIQVIDTVETFRDMLSGMHDTYLSSISNKMNDVMKVLTIFATIFIPLTFVAGVYGMNFNPKVSPMNMPELNWEWGYLSVWIVMILIGVSMLVYFRRKGWL